MIRTGAPGQHATADVSLTYCDDFVIVRPDLAKALLSRNTWVRCRMIYHRLKIECLIEKTGELVED